MKIRFIPDYHHHYPPINLTGNIQLVPGDIMPERPYCSMHQRYLDKNGNCVDCEKVQLALSYAQDIVDHWPTMTIRTIGQMTNRVNALKEALELTKSVRTYKGQR